MWTKPFSGSRRSPVSSKTMARSWTCSKPCCAGRPAKSDLRWLYHHREKRAKDNDGKATVLLEWAQFEEREAGQPASALELYRRVLDGGAGSVAALDAVVRLATELEKPELAIAALEQHRELSEGRDRADKESSWRRSTCPPLAFAMPWKRSCARSTMAANRGSSFRVCSAWPRCPSCVARPRAS